MPTLFKLFGLIFRIYTRDHQPPHVHVISQEGEAIFIIDQEVTVKDNKGMKPKDVSLAVSILEENKEIILEEWNRLHGS
ncbi:MAG: DUF4160 domain-containing protein [Bacteroidales bacterium]|nr:DUF4160 domain-containing protein [Bacteroidales bacterium]